MGWHTRYKAMKSGLGLTNSDIAEITGNTSDSIKSVTQPNGSLPRWCRLAIVVYERMSEKSKSEQLVCDCGNKLTDKEVYFGHCLQCDKNVEE